MTKFRGILFLALAFAGIVSTAPPVRAGGDWNDKGVQWRPYKEGLEEAAKDKKPVCLILYTEWCPHCTNYSKLFHDASVIEKSKKFVMIRVEADSNKDISTKHAPDGEYIPRTFFLSPKGEPDPTIVARTDKYKYFYGEGSPSSLLAGMDKALAKYSPGAAAPPSAPAPPAAKK